MLWDDPHRARSPELLRALGPGDPRARRPLPRGRGRRRDDRGHGRAGRGDAVGHRGERVGRRLGRPVAGHRVRRAPGDAGRGAGAVGRSVAARPAGGGAGRGQGGRGARARCWWRTARRSRWRTSTTRGSGSWCARVGVDAIPVDDAVARAVRRARAVRARRRGHRGDDRPAALRDRLRRREQPARVRGRWTTRSWRAGSSTRRTSW